MEEKKWGLFEKTCDFVVTFVEELRLLSVDVLKNPMSEEILTTAFTRLRQRLLRLAGSLLVDDEKASDALQDAFCRLWPKREKIHTAEEAQALSVVTVRNLCLDELRKRRQESGLDEADDLLQVESAHDRMERDEQYRMVMRLMEEVLTPTQRLIFRQKEIEEKTIEEIAGLHNMQETAVRMHLSRARKAIREQYNKMSEL